MDGKNLHWRVVRRTRRARDEARLRDVVAFGATKVRSCELMEGSWEDADFHRWLSLGTGMAVWAPRCRTVQLDVANERLDLEPVGHGWFADDIVLEHGCRYGFSLDGAATLPDPRSAWQPDGIRGLSATFDATTYTWRSAPPDIDLDKCVIYELHVGTFTTAATFEGVIGRLDYLVDLGVGAVELMPVGQFLGRFGWGYDGVLPGAPHNAYGGPDGLLRLVDACHERGLAVFLDIVHNHFGPGADFLQAFGPYFSTSATTPWGPAPNLDGPGSIHVRRFLIDSASRFFETFMVDGFRIDAASWIADRSPSHYLSLLRETLEAKAASLGRQIFLIAEADNQPRYTDSPRSGGYGLTAQWSKDFHHSLHARLTHERDGYYGDYGTLKHIARAITHGFVYQGEYCPSRDRVRGAPLDGTIPRLVAYLQNHDEVGNRSDGARIAALVGEELATAAAALIILSAHIPLIFQGEEWASTIPFSFFHDVHNVDLLVGDEATASHLLPEGAEQFASSQLAWDELESANHQRSLEWYRGLIRLRTHHTDLANLDFSRTEVLFNEEHNWITLRRGRILVAVNLSDRSQTLPLPAGLHRVLLQSVPPQLSESNIELPAKSAAVVECDSA